MKRPEKKRHGSTKPLSVCRWRGCRHPRVRHPSLSEGKISIYSSRWVASAPTVGGLI